MSFHIIDIHQRVRTKYSRTLLSENIEFQYYTEQEGLGSDMVLSMIEDSQKNLWIASENALSKFNPETEAFENYSTGFLRQKMNFSEAIPTINARQQQKYICQIVCDSSSYSFMADATPAIPLLTNCVSAASFAAIFTPLPVTAVTASVSASPDTITLSITFLLAFIDEPP